MADIVIGKLGNRWCSAGLIWDRDQKGGYINLLTFTLDVGYGKFGASKATWDFTCKRMRKDPLAERVERDQRD
jgi:hypothetical protein